METQLRAEARRTGRPFKTLVNELLRAGLAQRKQVRAQPPFSINALDLGGTQPGVSLDNIGALLDELEGPERS